MIFLQITPDTRSYMILGYVVIFSVLFLYLTSLVLRFRNMHRDVELLEDLERQENEGLSMVERTAAPQGDNPTLANK